MLRKINGAAEAKVIPVSFRTELLKVIYSLYFSLFFRFGFVIHFKPLSKDKKNFTYVINLPLKTASPSINQKRKIRYQKIRKPLGSIDHPGGETNLSSS
jgi:hypothetical protein